MNNIVYFSLTTFLSRFEKHVFKYNEAWATRDWRHNSNCKVSILNCASDRNISTVYKCCILVLKLEMSLRPIYAFNHHVWHIHVTPQVINNFKKINIWLGKGQ